MTGDLNTAYGHRPVYIRGEAATKTLRFERRDEWLGISSEGLGLQYEKTAGFKLSRRFHILCAAPTPPTLLNP